MCKNGNYMHTNCNTVKVFLIVKIRITKTEYQDDVINVGEYT